MFDCSNVRLFPPRFEDDLAIVDLVIRVVILFNFQLPIFKDQSKVFDISAEKAMEQENVCISFTLGTSRSSQSESYNGISIPCTTTTSAYD